MPTGKVKWFNNTKGYGFILPINSNGDDLFVHYSSIQIEGYKTLRAGQTVSFDIVQGPKGLHAIQVEPVENEFVACSVSGDINPLFNTEAIL